MQLEPYFLVELYYAYWFVKIFIWYCRVSRENSLKKIKLNDESKTHEKIRSTYCNAICIEIENCSIKVNLRTYTNYIVWFQLPFINYENYEIWQTDP